MAAFLAGDPVHIKNNLKTEVDLEWLPLGEIGAPGPDSNPILNSASSPVLALSEAPAAEDCFTLHPATHVIGIGCERGVSIDDVRSLLETALADAGVALGAVACLATIDLKEDERAFRELAAEWGLPLRLYTAAELEQETPGYKIPPLMFSRLWAATVLLKPPRFGRQAPALNWCYRNVRMSGRPAP